MILQPLMIAIFLAENPLKKSIPLFRLNYRCCQIINRYLTVSLQAVLYFNFLYQREFGIRIACK